MVFPGSMRAPTKFPSWSDVLPLEQLRLNRPALVAYCLEKRRHERESIHHTEVLQRLAEAQRELRFLPQRLEQQLGRE